MPTGKRASMREGPLADLFRKTAADAGETSEETKPAERKAAAPAERKAAAPAEPEAAAPAERRAAAPAEPEAPVAPPPSVEPRRRTSHPALEATPSAGVEEHKP